MFLRDQYYGTRLIFRKIYYIAMSRSLMSWFAFEEKAALDELTAALGPLPEEWVHSLGT